MYIYWIHFYLPLSLVLNSSRSCDLISMFKEIVCFVNIFVEMFLDFYIIWQRVVIFKCFSMFIAIRKPCISHQYLIFFSFFIFIFWDKVLCHPGAAEAHYTAAENVHNLTSTSIFPMQGWHACATILLSYFLTAFFFLNYFFFRISCKYCI